MAIATPKLIMARIIEAQENSPIAVFRCNRPGVLNAVFAGSSTTQQQIKDSKTGLVGVYDKTSELTSVYMELRDHAFRDIGGSKQSPAEVV